MSTAILRSVASSGVHVRPITRPDHVDAAAPLMLVPPLQMGQQQALDLKFPAPQPFVPVIVHPPAAAGLGARTLESWEGSDVTDEFFERQPTTRSQLPEPGAWAHRYGQAWVEAAVGRRPTKQLSRWSTPQVLHKLQTDRCEASSARLTRTSPAVVRSVRVDEPADGVAEVAAVVRIRDRSRALILRLEGWDGRWICTFAALV
jgi:hypothetical protein